MQFLTALTAVIGLASLAVAEAKELKPRQASCSFTYTIYTTYSPTITLYNIVVGTTTEINCNGCLLVTKTITRAGKKPASTKTVTNAGTKTVKVPFCTPPPNGKKTKATGIIETDDEEE
ncbi:hypothetical protein ABW20_dc0106845 [Dactylellina cionopaga]|nr:hypothetical protein ABW20_dc0106845 [Dactylellina cionopaga]